MSHKTAATVAHTIGIDTGKNTLHLIGLDDKGAIVLREKVVRDRITARLANVPRCLIGIEAGMATHYVARELSALGHDVKQVPPAYAKPFRQGHKNDFRDAYAIAEAVQRPSTRCVPVMTVPGIGPLIASAMVAAIGNGAAFAKGRDFAAWLGLVPKQMSTGDRTILGRITKRGNRYLRTLFMQGARVILLRPANWAKHSFGPWLTAAANRLHHNVLATALANKLARIAWTVLMQARSYEARVEPRTA